MQLTTETLTDASTRPAFIKTFDRTDPETEATVPGYDLKTTQMKDGESVTLQIESDPTGWQAYPSKFGGENLKAYFQTEDGTPVSSYIRIGDNAQRAAGFGVTFAEALMEYSAGDIVNIRLEEKPAKNAEHHFKIFHITQVPDFQ